MTTREAFRGAQRAILDRYGVAAESHFLQVPGLDGPAHVLRVGEGTDVVLVPGFSDPAAFWTPLLAQLPGYHLHASSFHPMGVAFYTKIGLEIIGQFEWRFHNGYRWMDVLETRFARYLIEDEHPIP